MNKMIHLVRLRSVVGRSVQFLLQQHMQKDKRKREGEIEKEAEEMRKQEESKKRGGERAPENEMEIEKSGS